ncbi:MAG: ABC transporter ATP-binding protein [Rhodospirillales bacterium]|nr:ABC transporter ATP-binding protein [Rhodospirillales bacterium]
MRYVALDVHRDFCEVAIVERVAIVGRNGAGKSSLDRAVAGMVAAAEGRIVWDGEDITALPPNARVKRGIALAPEGRRVFRDLTVTDSLLGGGSTLPASKMSARIDEIYAIFPRLRERVKQPASQLSGGEAQMLAIGQALMTSPRLIMLDEPSFGLAPVVVRRLLDIIRELASTGLSVLLLEQSVRLATELADAVYVVDGGELRFAGDAASGIDHEAIQAVYLGAATTA